MEFTQNAEIDLDLEINLMSVGGVATSWNFGDSYAQLALSEVTALPAVAQTFSFKTTEGLRYTGEVSMTGPYMSVALMLALLGQSTDNVTMTGLIDPDGPQF
ncbi:MAG: hypothetical protein AAF492_29530, partial [Verrucomicrobiota bacterium]